MSMIVFDTLCELLKKAKNVKESGTKIVFQNNDLVKQFGFVDTKTNIAYVIPGENIVIGNTDGIGFTKEELFSKIATVEGKRSLISGE